MSAVGGFRPVVLRGGRQEVEMARCPSEDVLILFASSLPGDDAEELLDRWSAEDITAHLAGCAACRATVEETGSLTAVLRADEIDEPPAELWDEMADEVMRSLEMPSLPKPGGAEVIPLHAEVPTATALPGRRRPWGWAAAALLVIGLTVTIAVVRQADDASPVSVAEDGAAAAALPDRATAEALAAEIGMSLDTIDPVAVADAEMMDASASLADAGVSAMVQDLDRDETEMLDLGLGDDLFGTLVELDAEELTALLRSLES